MKLRLSQRRLFSLLSPGRLCHMVYCSGIQPFLFAYLHMSFLFNFVSPKLLVYNSSYTSKINYIYHEIIFFSILLEPQDVFVYPRGYAYHKLNTTGLMDTYQCFGGIFCLFSRKKSKRVNLLFYLESRMTSSDSTDSYHRKR
jgi:hypothetical protein